MYRRIAWTLVFALTAGLALSQERKPVTFEDLLGLAGVDSPMISPDGDSVVYVVTSWEEDDDGKMQSVGHLWRVSTDGSAPAQLTSSPKGESAPAWSPDGKWMSFLSARGGGNDDEPKPQIWLLNATGGEAVQLTESAEGVASYAWSPDGSAVAFTTRDALSPEEEKARDRRDDQAVFEGDDRMVHLWTVDVSEGTTQRRTEGKAFDVQGSPSWSSDGTRIAFAAKPTRWTRDGRSDVYLVTLADNRVEAITTNPGPDDAPAFSPDGRFIAFLTTPNATEPLPDGTQVGALANARIGLYDVGARRVDVLSDPSFDLIPGAPRWTPDGKRLLFTVGERVYREAYAYDLESERFQRLTTGRLVELGPTSKDGSLVAFTLQSSTEPEDVYVAGPDFASPRKLTTTNPQTARFAIGATDVVTWKSSDGLDVEGLLLKPVGYEPGRRYPLLVVAHGGPTGAHMDSYRVGYGDGGQHWAGQGWAVLYPNPRGSTNYGETFMRANLADWGGGDYRDIMSGVDAVIAMGVANPEKLAIQGWSYGGYMTCWTVTQTSRFKAAMIGAGLTNLVSMYGTNDIPNYLSTFFEGALSPETVHLYRERSGLTHVERVTTPTLILHGGSDERVPVGQPMEFYRALKDRGVATELVFYPREGHGFREYYHRLDRLRRQYDWIKRYTLGDEATPPPTSGR